MEPPGSAKGREVLILWGYWDYSANRFVADESLNPFLGGDTHPDELVYRSDLSGAMVYLGKDEDGEMLWGWFNPVTRKITPDQGANPVKGATQQGDDFGWPPDEQQRRIEKVERLFTELKAALPGTRTPTEFSSDPDSIYLALHGEPFPYPDEIGGFPFVSRFEWGASDLNPVTSEKPSYGEGLYSTGENGNPEGYLVYDSPIEDVYHTIVIHDTGFSRDAYGYQDGAGMVMSTQSFHQTMPTFDANGVPNLDTGYAYADIGYHFVIAPDGTIFEGRDIRARGAHVEVEFDDLDQVIAGNTGSLGIALIGNDEVEDPTPEQIAALEQLVGYLIELLPGVGCVAGHGTINPGSRGTEGNDLAQQLADKYDTLNYGNCYPVK